jgi:ribosome-associated protein
MARDVAIRGEMIRLGQLLKLVDLVDGGGEVKDYLSAVEVYVNGEREDRRGRQLHPGDIVRAGADELRLVAGAA